jgi:hypothetical protein
MHSNAAALLARNVLSMHMCSFSAGRKSEHPVLRAKKRTPAGKKANTCGQKSEHLRAKKRTPAGKKANTCGQKSEHPLP